MCGRFSLFTTGAALAERFGVEVPDLEPRYNCAPGQTLPVITSDAPDVLTTQQWGFVPSWAEDRKRSHINARGETVRTKRTFASAFERRRCLVPADGFYEWAATGTGKQPYRIAYEDDRPFAMAGIWERWTPPTSQTGLADFGAGGATPDQDPIETFAIITTDPNDVVRDLHDRMPVVLAPAEEELWLGGDPDEVASLLDPAPSESWRSYPVSTRVNNPRNDDPSIVERQQGA